MDTLTFRQHTAALAVVRLAADATVPDWVHGEFVSVTRTPSELSIVCDAPGVPSELWDLEPWVRFEVAGPLDLSLTGVLARIASSLADAEIPIFAVATYDTDHVLVRRSTAADAVTALRSAGHVVI
jgi:uncharacterized protein